MPSSQSASDGTTQALPVGTHLEEFIIERVLGSGGFGITYLAQDSSLGRRVVIKENLPVQFCWRETSSLTVRPRHTEGEDVENFQYSLESFEREATTLASLDHPGIVRVLRSFEAYGTAYFVMPFVEGTALDAVIRQRAEQEQTFTEEEILDMLIKVLEALGYLHDRGIYHRDIKPGNILVTATGEPVLIDFGAARQRLSERSLTVIESAGYTPFEQLQTRGKIGPWSDIYALGATLYKVITGETPAKANDRAFDDPSLPLAQRAELRGRYSPRLLESIDQAMAPKASERFQDTAQWRERVESRNVIAPPVQTPRIITSQPASRKESPRIEPIAYDDKLYGVHGWLKFFQYWLIIMAADVLRKIWQDFPQALELQKKVHNIPQLSWNLCWIYLDLAFAIFLCTLIFIVADKIRRVDARALIFLKRTLLFAMFYIFGDSLVWGLHNPPIYTSDDIRLTLAVNGVIGSQWLVIWLYFTNSRRVANTYGAWKTVTHVNASEKLRQMALTGCAWVGMPIAVVIISLFLAVLYQTLALNSKADAEVVRIAKDKALATALVVVPSAASKSTPFINSLGMRFVPVKITGGPTSGEPVLFSIWDTRVKDYAAYAKAKGITPEKSWFEQTEDDPVVNVSWEDAKAFCAWLTASELTAGRLPLSWEYRLPSDHEWSCAIGIGEKEDAAATPKEKDAKLEGVYPWGNAWSPPKGFGNYSSNVAGDSFAYTSPVGSFPADHNGLYDMSGNVWQWCEDWIDSGKTNRVLRSASWNDDMNFLMRSAYRRNGAPRGRFGSSGFRCVLVLAGG